MTYVQGFLIPVPTAKRDAYLQMATEAAPLFQEAGASRVVETWGIEVPEGKRTDMRRAVQATPEESIVFSWIEYPDQATAATAAERMQADERMTMPPEMPFDPKRMIYAGFEVIVKEGGDGGFGYVDGLVAAVPKEKRAAYLDFARRTAPVFHKHGMTASVDSWAEDVADGKVTDFKRAVAAEPDEAIVFAWVAWPDKATRDAAWAAMMEDPAMQGGDMPFDGGRMIFGGFETILDTASEGDKA